MPSIVNCAVLLIDFEDNTLGGFVESGSGFSGSASNPWTPDASAACDGTSFGVKAGDPGGVDSESFLTLNAPAGATSMTYFYSYPIGLDAGDDFHVIINAVVERSYETGPGATCEMDTLPLAGGDIVEFYCKSGGLGETCAIDQVCFN